MDVHVAEISDKGALFQWYLAFTTHNPYWSVLLKP